MLRSEAKDERWSSSLAFVVYDLLCDEGRDIRQFSVLYRRLLLAAIVQGTAIALSPLIDGTSKTALAASARLGFRGVVAKRAGSAYHPSSLAHDWVKLAFEIPANVIAFARRVRSPLNDPQGRRSVTDFVPA